jgi:hypothetical protein
MLPLGLALLPVVYLLIGAFVFMLVTGSAVLIVE